MTPGTFNIPLYLGTKYEHTLTLESPDPSDPDPENPTTFVPLDLTGLDPFVCTLSHERKDEVLATLTVVGVGALSGGVIKITLLPADQDLLVLGHVVRIGLRDALDNPILQGTIPILFFSGES